MDGATAPTSGWAGEVRPLTGGRRHDVAGSSGVSPTRRLRLAGGVFGGSGSIVEASTLAFTALVLAQLFNTPTPVPIA
jgi:hypothetical protein